MPTDMPPASLKYACRDWKTAQKWDLAVTSYLNIQQKIELLMKLNIPNRSVEYLDNRMSRYSMKMGKCEITNISKLS